MPIRRRFQTTVPQPTPTYDFTSFTDGVGYTVFYGYASHDDDSIEYKLSPQQLPSANEEVVNNIKPYLESTSGTKTNTSIEEVLTRTFTSEPFNNSRIVEGTAKIVFCVDHKISASDVAINYSFTGTIYSYDGSTQTQIGTATTEEVSTSEGAGLSTIITLDIPIATAVIPHGHQIQAKIDFDAYKGGNGTSYELILGHDGLDRAGQTIDPTSAFETTLLEVHIPFKIFE